MAGLLDALNSRDGIFALGLLQAAAPQPVRQSFGGGLLSALGQANAWQQQQDDRAASKADREQRAQMLALQMQQLQAQQAAQQQAAMQAQRQRQLLSDTFAPTTPIQANAVSGITGPRPEALGVVGQRKPVDWQALIAAGVPPELVKSLAEAPNLGRAEVARTVDGMDAQGRPSTLQFDKYGLQIGPGVQQWKAPERVDLGGSVGFVDPVTQAVLQRFGKTNSPDALLSAATARRGQDMTDARSRDANATAAAAAGKVEWKQDVNGRWIALPKEISGDGPVTPVVAAAPGKREQQAQNALGIIDEAEKLIDKGTSSYIGAGADQAARLFGVATSGAQAGAQLKALEGALMMAQPRMEGPQSDKDVALYRQMAAQLGDSTVPAASKKAALQVIRALHSRYAGGGGASGSWEAAAPGAGKAPMVGQVVDGYRYKGGDPADRASWEQAR